jgi:hypothetical protein
VQAAVLFFIPLWRNQIMILELIIGLTLLLIIALLFWPQRSTHYRDVTGTRNSWERGRGDW